MLNIEYNNTPNSITEPSLFFQPFSRLVRPVHDGMHFLATCQRGEYLSRAVKETSNIAFVLVLTS